jgi:hypothetical protein
MILVKNRIIFNVGGHFVSFIALAFFLIVKSGLFDEVSLLYYNYQIKL